MNVLIASAHQANGAALGNCAFSHPASAGLKYHERANTTDPSGKGANVELFDREQFHARPTDEVF
jgi:hypothetical protein